MAERYCRREKPAGRSLHDQTGRLGTEDSCANYCVCSLRLELYDRVLLYTETAAVQLDGFDYAAQAFPVGKLSCWRTKLTIVASKHLDGLKVLCKYEGLILASPRRPRIPGTRDARQHEAASRIPRPVTPIDLNRFAVRIRYAGVRCTGARWSVDGADDCCAGLQKTET